MSSIRHKLQTFFHTPRILWIKFAHCRVFRYLPDKIAIQIIFKNIFHKKLDWDNPKSFNEKLQWLKLNDRKPVYTTMVDKYAVKQYVAKIIGEEHVIPTLGVWDHADDIDFDALPEQFVLKCTHGSGDVVICKDKSIFDRKKAKRKLKKALKTDFYSIAREWPYKNVPRRIIAEPFMVDLETGELRDYKFFCFDGIPKCLFVATDRAADCRFDYFDADFNHLPIYNIHANSEKTIEKPQCFEEMSELARVLSKGFPFIRIDLYQINGKVYFGEYTLFHAGGFSIYEPESWDYKMGEWLRLPIEGGR